MSDIHDQKEQKLDAMLYARRFEPMSPDLAERIILKARQLPQNQTIPVMQWLQQLFAEFSLPQPAYVLACALILGIVVGFNTPVENRGVEEPDLMHVQSFLYADEDVL